MPDDPRSLRRLGGGRWQTRATSASPSSPPGRWLVVDGETTDELGLSRVHGPYESLADARDAIEAIRAEPAAMSPLADQLRAARDRPPRPDVASKSRRSPRTATTKVRPPEPGKPEEPEEPDWIADLPPRNAAGRGARRSRGPWPGRRGRSRPRRSRGWSAGHRRGIAPPAGGGIGRGGARSGTRTPRRRRRGRSRRQDPGSCRRC